VNSKIVRAGCVAGASVLCVLLWLALPAGAQEQKEAAKQQPVGGQVQKEAPPQGAGGQAQKETPKQQQGAGGQAGGASQQAGGGGQGQKEPAKTEAGGGGGSAGAGGGGGRARGSEIGPHEASGAPVPGPSARFEATVFEVVMAPESGIGLDAKKLAADGPTPAKLVAALAPLGNARLLYRIDQVVPIDGHATHIEVSRDVPYVTGPQIGPPGTPQPPGISIGRTKGGVRFELNAFCPDQADPRFQATIDVKLATMNASATKLGGDVTAPEFSDITQKYGGVAELGRPIVLLTVDGTTTGGAEESRAYVTLITLSAAGK